MRPPLRPVDDVPASEIESAKLRPPAVGLPPAAPESEARNPDLPAEEIRHLIRQLKNSDRLEPLLKRALEGSFSSSPSQPPITVAFNGVLQALKPLPMPEKKRVLRAALALLFDDE
jgi:hypothetical protein